MCILAFDITRQENAEKQRREFTANVSHELKTPLHSIMGAAELIENNLVKPDDLPRFVSRIRTESSRLVALIDDIIRLSQLDEGQSLPTQSVDLAQLCEQVAIDLHEQAAERDVTLHAEGAQTLVCGVPHLLYEIVYNLCDNAIKYNVQGGTVTLQTSVDGGHPVLCVTDTGIGIPPSEQNRVFERFYRVDKSHSKQTGGTGLGLSIVKHAAMHHGAQIELDSRMGQGTTITVRFPVPSQA